MKPGNVPTARIAPLLATFIAERWPDTDGFEILAEKVGCHQDAIRQIIYQRHEGCEFDLVDKLFCALGRVDVWQGALKDIYDSVSFVQTCSLPSCMKTFPERARNGCRQRYCSARCRVLHSNVRRGRGTGQRLRQKNRCLKGHLFTPENTITFLSADKTRTIRRCRTCKRAKDLAHWNRKQKVAA